MSIENIRLSEKAKSQLVTVKRRTGIQHWNVLCRWALCLSLAEKSVPPVEDVPSDSNVEMTWKTFSGHNEDLFLALLKQRGRSDGILDEDVRLPELLRLHLNRGISYLATLTEQRDIKSLLASVS
jgi:DNA sulfur modification protein DndE